MITVVFAVILGLLGAAIYRIRGSGDTPLNINPIPELLFSSMVGAMVYLNMYDSWASVSPWVCIVSICFATFVLLKGHGQYITFWFVGHSRPRRIKPEDLDVLVTPLFGEDPRTTKAFGKNHVDTDALIKAYGERKLYWRCAFGLWVKNTLFLLPAILIQSSFSVLPLAMTLIMPLSYMAGWKLAPKYKASKKFPSIADDAHKISELIFGAITFTVGYFAIMGV